MSTVPCHRGGSECKWPACDPSCDGRPGREWTQSQIDDHMLQDDDPEDDDWDEMMCSMGPDGQCGAAGSEYCDFECKTMAAVRAESRAQKPNR